MRIKPTIIATTVYVFPVIVSLIVCLMLWASREAYRESAILFVVPFFIMAVILVNGFANAMDNPTRRALIQQLTPLTAGAGDRDKAEEDLQHAMERKAWINNLGFIAPLLIIIQQLTTKLLG